MLINLYYEQNQNYMYIKHPIYLYSYQIIISNVWNNLFIYIIIKIIFTRWLLLADKVAYQYKLLIQSRI